ncbi:MAG: hypothetical protein JXQ96_01475 [Cyclobacteriaceae bacterium]
MKKILLFITAFVISLSTSYAGGAYERTMGESIGQIFSSKSEDMDALANKFNRIGEAEKDKWLPYYYASMTYIFKSFQLQESTAKDQALQSAQQSLDKAKDLVEANSEISSLQGFLYMISLSVDPANRGQSMSPKAFAAFEKALALNPKNPRAILFKGQMMYGAAEFFGSGTEEACGMVLKSIEIFEAQEGNQTMQPSWGIVSARQYQEKCNSVSK